VVFLSIEEVSIPKLGKIFRVPKIFEVSNSLVSRIENFFQICDITTSSDCKARSKFFKRVLLLVSPPGRYQRMADRRLSGE
jgi:hypothetical protein